MLDDEIQPYSSTMEQALGIRVRTSHKPSRSLVESRKVVRTSPV